MSRFNWLAELQLVKMRLEDNGARRVPSSRLGNILVILIFSRILAQRTGYKEADEARKMTLSCTFRSSRFFPKHSEPNQAILSWLSTMSSQEEFQPPVGPPPPQVRLEMPDHSSGCRP